MKKIIFSVGISLALTGVLYAEDGPPGLEKKNGVPPGLQKKGGVPPGLAKKQGQQQAPAQVAAAPAATPATPAAPSTPAAPPAAQTPAAQTPAANAPTQPTTTKPAISHREAKERLDRELQIIPERVHETHLEGPALNKISRITGVPVERLKEQQKEYNAGYPGLLMGNLIAKQSKATFKQLIAERKANNTSWSTIAQRRNVEVQPLLESALELKRHINQAQQRRN